MFDFGNKKLIEMLENEIDRLNREKKEYIKTVEYLTNKIDELNDKIKKIDENLEYEKKEKEECNKKYDDEKEYNFPVAKINIKTKKSKEKLFEIEDIDYIEIKKEFKKCDFEFSYDNKNYETNFFYKENEILTTELIKKMIKNKQIPMYQGIPFRKLQDLYKIMEFLESEKNTDYKKEVNFFDFTDRINLNKNKIYIEDTEINNKNIYNTINKKQDYIYLKNKKIELYKTRNILIFNNKEFKNVKELMRLIKEKCYKDKELLISVINNL